VDINFFLTVLYVEIYVTFLAAVIVYVLYELFNVEAEKAREEEGKKPVEPRPPIAFPRFAVWLLVPGIIFVIVAWVVTFAANATKTITLGAENSEKWYAFIVRWLNDAEASAWLFSTTKWLFYVGSVAVAISLLVFGYKAAVHPRPVLWFYRAGIVAMVVGLLAFAASAAVGCIVHVIHSGTIPLVQVGLVNGLLSPFFFVGLPLGFYWLHRSKQAAAVQTGKRR
jgi:hypothetical protein